LASEIYEYIMTMDDDNKEKLIQLLSQFENTDKLIDLIFENE
jgi:hypothetical protein